MAAVSSRRLVNVLLGTLVLVGLYFSSLRNYLLFHTLAEMFSIVVACGIFIIGWNSRHYIKNNYLVFLAIAYLFIAFLDLMHTVSYKGMGMFDYQYYANQLWIATRYMESLSLLVAFLFVREQRRFNPPVVFAAYAAFTLLIMAAIFWWHIFPVCFVEGQGLTPFKKISEYVICSILLLDIWLLLRLRDQFDRDVHRWLVWSLSFTIASELAFTFYISNYGFSNLVGHYFKIFSFYLIYKALVATGITTPHAVLFRALQDSESKYRALVESSTDIIWEEDRQGVYTYVSPHVHEILGYAPDEMIGRPMADFLEPGEAVAARAIFDAPGTSCPCQVNRESVFVRKDGSTAVLERHGAAIVDDDGEVRGFRGVDRDVTVRHGQETELLKLLRAVEDNPIAIVITGPAGVVEYGNPVFRELMGAESSEAPFRTLVERLTEVGGGDALAGLAAALKAGTAWQGEVHLSRGDGDSRWIRLTVSPVTDASGGPVNCIAALEDVTDRMELDLLKENVNQIMRHDLKSPLNGIIAIPALLLEDGNLTSEQRTMLQALEEGSRRMLRMINNSLDLFKMERGTFKFNPEPVDVVKVLRSVASELGPLSRAGDVGVELGGAGTGLERPLLVRAEEDLLHNVFANLMANALEASPPGGTVSIGVEGNGQGVVRIRNRGAVPREIRSQFFQKFKTYGKKRGTGLGAYSAKLLADAMGLTLSLSIDDERDTTEISVACPLFD